MSDFGNHCIQILNRKGEFVRKFGSPGAGNGQMKNPCGVRLLSNGDIVGAGRLETPWHLFVDSDDNILVADFRNNRIQVFHQDGSYIKALGSGQIFGPEGVCMDDEGRIIVSEGGYGGQKTRSFRFFPLC